MVSSIEKEKNTFTILLRTIRTKMKSTTVQQWHTVEIGFLVQTSAAKKVSKSIFYLILSKQKQPPFKSSGKKEPSNQTWAATRQRKNSNASKQARRTIRGKKKLPGFVPTHIGKLALDCTGNWPLDRCLRFSGGAQKMTCSRIKALFRHWPPPGLAKSRPGRSHHRLIGPRVG